MLMRWYGIGISPVLGGRMCFIVFAALGLSVESLWVRRYTWCSKWDCAATMGVAAMTANVTLMIPPLNRYLSPYLYRALGVWNVEQLIGHMLYLIGLMCFLYMTISRWGSSDRQRRRMIYTHIELPATFFIPTCIALFVMGGGGWGNIGDLVLANPPSLVPYWLVLGSGVLYLSSTTIALLIDVRKNPISRRTANAYIGACTTSLLCAVCGVIDIWHPFGGVLMWVVVRVELMSYAGAAMYSWRRRVANIGFSPA